MNANMKGWMNEWKNERINERKKDICYVRLKADFYQYVNQIQTDQIQTDQIQTDQIQRIWTNCNAIVVEGWLLRN